MKAFSEFLTEAYKESKPEYSHLNTAAISNFKNTHGAMYQLHHKLLGHDNNLSIDHDLDDIVYHPNARQIVQLNLDAASRLYKSAGDKMNKLPHDLIKKFVKNKSPKELTVEKFAKHVREHVKDKQALERRLAHIEEHKPTYQKALDMHLHLRNAKIALSQALSSNEDSKMDLDKQPTKFTIKKRWSIRPIKLQNKV